MLPSPNSAYGELRINWYFCHVHVSTISPNKQSHTSINNSNFLFLSQSSLFKTSLLKSHNDTSNVSRYSQQGANLSLSWLFSTIASWHPPCYFSPVTSTTLTRFLSNRNNNIYVCLARSSKFSYSYFQMWVLRHKMFLFQGQDHWFIKENTKFWKSFQLQIAPENITFMEVITI